MVEMAEAGVFRLQPLTGRQGRHGLNRARAAATANDTNAGGSSHTLVNRHHNRISLCFPALLLDGGHISTFVSKRIPISKQRLSAVPPHHHEARTDAKRDLSRRQSGRLYSIHSNSVVRVQQRSALRLHRRRSVLASGMFSPLDVRDTHLIKQGMGLLNSNSSPYPFSFPIMFISKLPIPLFHSSPTLEQDL